MWTVHVPLGKGGLLLNLKQENAWVLVCGYRRGPGNVPGRAELSGLVRVGDYITHVNSKRVETLQNVVDAIKIRRSWSPGGLVGLTLHPPLGTPFPTNATLVASDVESCLARGAAATKVRVRKTTQVKRAISDTEIDSKFGIKEVVLPGTLGKRIKRETCRPLPTNEGDHVRGGRPDRIGNIQVVA